MGYEYHDRRRNERGQFAEVYRDTQVHMYCNENEWRTLKAAANAAAEDLSGFCRAASLERARKVLLEQAITVFGHSEVPTG